MDCTDMQERLTAARVRELTLDRPPERETTIFDLVLPRFALRLRPPVKPGRPWPAAYFVRYVDSSGRERKVTVASPSTHSLDEARAAARIVLRRADSGGNPSAERVQARQAWTVKMAADAYTASAEFARNTERVRANDIANLRNHLLYRLSGILLAEIDVPVVRRFYRDVEGDTRINRRKRRMGGAGAARKCVRLLSAMLTWCVGEGRLDRNPIIGNLRLSGDNGRESVITRPEEYARLFEAMDHLTAEGRLRPQARAFITLIAATGMRRGEAQSLRWGAVDIANRRIILTDSKGTKLTRSGPRREAISLPPLAAAALAGIRPVSAADDEQVFVPAQGKVIETGRVWRMVRDAAGLPSDLVLHSLRHSVGTAAVMAGLSLPEVQRLLRHRNISTTSRYIHLADSAQGRLQDRATAHLLPAPSSPPANPPARLRREM
jgi:integrase